MIDLSCIREGVSEYINSDPPKTAFCSITVLYNFLLYSFPVALYNFIPSQLLVQ